MPPADDDARSGPRVPFGRDSVRPAPKPASGPMIPFGAARVPRTLNDGPRIVGGGIVRLRISCSIDELRTLDPAVSDPVLRQAKRVVDAVNFDDHEFDDVVRFGAPLQEEHGRLAEDQLALAGDARLEEAKRLSSDLLAQLSQLNPASLFDRDRGLIDGMKAALSRSAELESFQQRSAAVLQTARQIKERSQEFAEFERRANLLMKRWITLGVGLDAHLLAGRFLTRHIAEHPLPDPGAAAHRLSQTGALETRLASLASTASSVALGERVLQAIISTIGGARTFAEDMIDSDLPVWQTACAAALIARSEGRSFDASPIRSLYEKLVKTLTRRN
ncbi:MULTISPECIES: hypothetical protein [unclassified Rhizobium]